MTCAEGEMKIPGGDTSRTGSPPPDLTRVHRPTPSQTAGPFVCLGTEWVVCAKTAGEGGPGAIVVTGSIADGAALPVTDAMLEFWQADVDGHFLPDCPSTSTGFTRVFTSIDGGYRLVTVKPGPVPGEAGTTQAPHIDVSIFARGLVQRLITRIYFSDEEANQDDPVLASLPDQELRQRLVAHLTEDAAEAPVYRLDIRLQGERESVFFAPW